MAQPATTWWLERTRSEMLLGHSKCVQPNREVNALCRVFLQVILAEATPLVAKLAFSG